MPVRSDQNKQEKGAITGRLVEIYEPWEKPGGLSQDSVAQVAERIKQSSIQPGTLYISYHAECALCPTIQIGTLILSSAASALRRKGWTTPPKAGWKWVCPKCKEILDASTTD